MDCFQIAPLSGKCSSRMPGPMSATSECRSMVMYGALLPRSLPWTASSVGGDMLSIAGAAKVVAFFRSP
jgi:hypothetical protein